MVNTLISRLAYKTRFISTLLRKGKLSPAKGLIYARNRISHGLRQNPGTYHPSVIFVEPTNHCNIHCQGCHATRKMIYGDRFGFMDFGLFSEIIEEIRETAVLVALYWLGEPLLHKRLTDMVGLLSEKRIGSMVATNGMLLKPELCQGLVESGLDFLKIAISGMSPKIQTIYHRRSDIDLIRANFEALMDLLGGSGRRTFVMIDYIHFPYNTEEIGAAREYFGDFDVHFNVRPGVLTHDDLTKGPNLAGPPRSVSRPCDWLWGIANVNWEGLVFPCCHTGPLEHDGSLGDLRTEGFNRILSGSRLRKLREAHLKGRRSKVRFCRDCAYRGIDFQ